MPQDSKVVLKTQDISFATELPTLHVLLTFIVLPCEIRRLRPLILKSDWLFNGQYFPIFRLTSFSLPVRPTHFAFHVAVM